MLQAWCEQLPPGADVAAPDLERLADEFLRSPRAVVLAAGEPVATLRRRDGRTIPTAGVERTYSTPDLLALERRILDYACERHGAGMGVARPTATERAFKRRSTLAAEQLGMVRRLTQDGDGVVVVVGQAGCGKTFALSAAREAWEASGRPVYGGALARRAARELQDGAGIESTSLAALLGELARHPFTTLRPRSVLVLDEAGMLPTRELAQLVQHASALDIKLVLVGDHRQLPSIGAGGAFRGLQRRLPVIELRENRRQIAEWERDALHLVREGAVHEAAQRYDEADRIVVGDDAPQLRQRLVADWWAAGDVDEAVMIAQRRIDVADLNGRAHALMRNAGALGPEKIAVGRASFSVGDRVLIRRNDRALGVVNGDRGIVVAVDVPQRRVELDLGDRHATLDRNYLDRPTRHGPAAMMHGYAITSYVAQGLTCRQTFVLATDQLTREAGYVALSRGREANRLYALTRAASERAEYAPSVHRAADAGPLLLPPSGRSRTQTLAADAAQASSPATAELLRVLRARSELEAIRADARVQLHQLEREQPGRFQRKARNAHIAARGEAAAREHRADRQLQLLATRERTLKRVLMQERAPERQVEQLPARARTPVGDRDCGWELGR